MVALSVSSCSRQLLNLYSSSNQKRIRSPSNNSLFLCDFFVMEVTWRYLRAERQAKRSSCVHIGMCPSLLPSGRECWQGWREMTLLQPEEQKSFGGKVRAARGEPCSSHPAAPAHDALSVSPPLSLASTLFGCGSQWD